MKPAGVGGKYNANTRSAALDGYPQRRDPRPLVLSPHMHCRWGGHASCDSSTFIVFHYSIHEATAHPYHRRRTGSFIR